MKYIERTLKGTFGYIRKQRRFEAAKTILLFIMAFGLFFIGLITLKTEKSLWSVFAVLALLPACKSLVGLIMLARFSSLSDDKYTLYSDTARDVATVYENILTTSARSFYSPVIAYASGNIIVLTADNEKEPDVLRAHLEQVLLNAGHNATVKVFTDETLFLNRLKELSDKYGNDGSAKGAGIMETIKAVSL